MDVYRLSNEVSVQVDRRFNHQLTLELRDSGSSIPSPSITLDNQQCSTLTRQLCETTDELHELLIELLVGSPPIGAGIRLIGDDRLELSVPIHYGTRNRTKTWAFIIEFPRDAPSANTDPAELTLDPSDWTDTRALSHQIMNDMIDYLRDVRQRPTWRPMPPEVKQAFKQTDLPLEGQSPWKVYEDVCSLVLPYPTGNIHPSFWGYVKGTGSIIGVLAELITGTMNNNAWGGHQASIYVEQQVLLWLKIIMGFPPDESSSGILITGSSVATIIAMAVARQKFNGKKMKVYCSTEAHNCVARAVKLLAIGKENLVMVRTNSERQIDLQLLEESIDSTCCGMVIGNACAVGTGAIDDLNGLADLCARRPNELWFHVDGAIGAVGRCSTRLQPLFAGLERADSVGFDLHKWLFVPYECGCILIRDGQLHRATFAPPAPAYMTPVKGGIAPGEGETFFSDYGMELSRSMKALKVWMMFKAHGLEKLARILEQNVDQAQYFASLVVQHSDELELLARVQLNIVCFRYITPGDVDLNELNKRILIQIQERGVAIVSTLVIDGNVFAMRMCISNHRTRRADLDNFLQQLLSIGRELSTAS